MLQRHLLPLRHALAREAEILSELRLAAESFEDIHKDRVARFHCHASWIAAPVEGVKGRIDGRQQITYP